MEFKGIEKSLTLLEMRENEDNVLSIIVARTLKKLPEEYEAMYNLHIGDTLSEFLEKSYQSVVDYDHAFEITFDDYIMYQVRNEKFTYCDEYEQYHGEGLIIYFKSRLLDHFNEYIITESIPKEQAKENWTHFGIVTNSTLIDVISCKEPTIKKIDVEEVEDYYEEFDDDDINTIIVEKVEECNGLEKINKLLESYDVSDEDLNFDVMMFLTVEKVNGSRLIRVDIEPPVLIDNEFNNDNLIGYLPKVVSDNMDIEGSVDIDVVIDLENNKQVTIDEIYLLEYYDEIE